jgi:hypothetical protein
MLQEANKFREHQSRELLIEILEQQLEQRKKLSKELDEKIKQADTLLAIQTPPSTTMSMDES